MIQEIVTFFGDSGYHEMYHMHMKNMVRSVGLIDDCRFSAGYWHDISSSVKNLVLVKNDYLSEIF